MSLNAHVIECNIDPNVPPTFTGQHWINVLTGCMWLAVGTSVIGDWQKLDADTDQKVGVSSNDSTPGYLVDKVIVDTGTNTTNALEATEINDGGDEDYRIRLDETKVNHDNLLGFVADEHHASGSDNQNLFETINTPSGTNPVADSQTDTLNLTSSDSTVTITGNSATDTVDFKVNTANTNQNLFETVATPLGTNPVADSPTDTLTYTSSDGSVDITGNSTTDTVDFKVNTGNNDQNLFETMNTPLGSNPVADSTTDTLNWTSSDGSVDITGNSGTDTIDLKVNTTNNDQDLFQTVVVPNGTNPVADSPTDSLNLTSADSSVVITGNASTDTIDLIVDDSKIDHNNIANNGTNTHTQIDSHLADTNNPHNTKFYKTINVPAGTDPVADTVDDTLNFTSADSSVVITGTASTDTVDFSAVDRKVEVSSNDTTPGNLINKLQAGTNVSIVENNDGGNETLTISTNGVLDSILAGVQARRDTDLILTNTYQDITFNLTDVENEPSCLEHDNTNTDRILVKENGLYLIMFGITYCSSTTGTINAQVRKNDAIVLAGSFVEQTVASGDGDHSTSHSFLAELSANDFISVQAKENFGSVDIEYDTNFTVMKLKGAKGDQGNPGAGSTVLIADEGTNIANTPHSRFDFVGAGVTATDGGSGTTTITIPGGGGGGGDFSNNGDTAGANRSLGNNDAYSLSLETNNINRFTVAANGKLSASTSLSDYILDIQNTNGGGGGNGMRICGGELLGDIAFHVCDANDSFKILEIEADQGYMTHGKTYAQTLSDNGVVYGYDNQQSGVATDINTQNGIYRIGGNPLNINHLDDVDTNTAAPNIGDHLKWDGTNWVPDTITNRIGHTYAISGEIKVPSGDDDFIMPFFVSLAPGQTAKLVKARHRINSGTSVTCKLQKNGVDITGFTGITVNSTASNTDPTDVTLADDDMLALVITGVSGTPKNMTFTLFIEVTQ